MKGAIAKAMPAASAALRASWSRGHTSAAATPLATLWARMRSAEGGFSVVFSGLAIPAHPRAVWLLLQMDEPVSSPREPAGTRSGRGAGGLAHCGGQPLGSAVGPAFLAAA